RLFVLPGRGVQPHPDPQRSVDPAGPPRPSTPLASPALANCAAFRRLRRSPASFVVLSRPLFIGHARLRACISCDRRSAASHHRVPDAPRWRRAADGGGGAAILSALLSGRAPVRPVALAWRRDWRLGDDPQLPGGAADELALRHECPAAAP